METCFRVLKESNKCRFDSYSRQEQCIDHIPYCLSGLSRAHFSDNLSRNSCIPKNKTDFLTILSLMLSCYFQEKQRSFTSGDFWVLPRWQVTHFQFLSVFQDGGHVKFPTLGKARSVNFPWVARPPPPPPTLGLNIDRCIIINSNIYIYIYTEEWVVTPTKQVCIKLMVIRVE